MTRPAVTVTLITLNEERRLACALESVRFADEILVVDSGSTDKTVSIANRFGAKVIHHPWPGYGKQKNFAQSQATHDWVLNLDADEEVSKELQSEILTELEAIGRGESQAKGFCFPRKTFYLGRWIRHGGWYPDHKVRFANKNFAGWTEPAVHEALRVDGTVKLLEAPLLHYTFRDIQDQILQNLRFSKLGFEELQKRGEGASVLKLLFKPFWKFLDLYFLKRGFLDGLPGLIISINASHSLFLKYAYLIEAKIKYADSDCR